MAVILNELCHIGRYFFPLSLRYQKDNHGKAYVKNQSILSPNAGPRNVFKHRGHLWHNGDGDEVMIESLKWRVRLFYGVRF